MSPSKERRHFNAQVEPVPYHRVPTDIASTMATADGAKPDAEHTISVVIPVYHGEHTLTAVVKELAGFVSPYRTPEGRCCRVAEVVLVHDAAPDRSDVVIRRLAGEYPFVQAIWLSRNFGQHAATLAGMSSTGSDWIVTLDEDGQFDPGDIGAMLDVALDRRAQLVYGSPINPPPHGVVRNAASNLTKVLAVKVLSGGHLERFSSFRLMMGEVGRGVAAYVGPGVYLDVALTWVFGRTAVCPVTFRDEGDHRSGYSFRRLLSHFWQLVITAGTRPLRLVSLVGGLTALGGLLAAVVLVIRRVSNDITVQGWTSVMVVCLLLGGAILFSLGVIAEYVGAAVRMAMGKPLYLITSDPSDGPLNRDLPLQEQESLIE
jgi:glycosyltransferase involved in cell wall biosynthesis